MKDKNYTHVALVNFKDNTRSYSFKTTLSDLKCGDSVVVETIRGVELATLTHDLISMDDYKDKHELKPILRKAEAKDIAQFEENVEKAKEAMRLCNKEIAALNLDMNLIEAEYTLDARKITFVYVAEDRVDFRELLKRLAQIFHCRIELRQIGPRNKAKMVGGLGQCGQETCCSRFLNDFEMISINMAKNQLLALNIQKLSGQCGKLKCCLSYEDELYKELRKDLPKLNSKIVYDGKTYRISGLNVIIEQAKIENREDVRFVPFEELWPELYDRKTKVRKDDE